MKTGIKLITEERAEQIEKHGWCELHDDEHRAGELLQVAICLVRDDYSKFPDNWNPKYIKKFMEKKGVEALKVAGALIAAEIDRLHRLV